MGTFHVDLSSGGCHVYAMLCQDNGGPLYIKFGRSSRITQRLSELRISCPIPAKWFCTVDAINPLKQKNLEKELHRYFKPRQITGEWFKFDADSAEDKAAFNEGCRKCMDAVNLRGVYWDKISVPALDAYNKQRKKEFLEGVSKSGGARAYNRRKRGIQANIKEYSSYRDG